MRALGSPSRVYFFSMKIKDKEFETYLSSEVIQKRVEELSGLLNSDYRDQNPLFIAILNGAFMFAADLFRNLETPGEITFIKVSSYDQLSSTGNVKSLIGLNENLHNRNVVIV